MDPKPIAEVFGGLYLSDDQSVMGMNRPFWARLTSVNSSTGLYAWTELDYDTVNPVAWIDRPGGRSGTETLGPVFDANDVIAEVPTVATIQRAFFDGTYGDVYVVVCNTGSGILTINDNGEQNQTIGLGKEGVDINIATTAVAWAAGIVYRVGEIVEHTSLIYRCITENLSVGGINEPPSAEWIDVTGQGLNVINIPDTVQSINSNTTPRQTVGINRTGSVFNITTTPVEWKSGRVYREGDFVISSLVTYRCILENYNVAPPSLGTWVVVTELLPGWSSTQQYEIGWVVSYLSNYYYCITPSLNNVPPNTAYWAQITDNGINVINIPASVSGITSINDDTTASQTIGLGVSGSDINISATPAAWSSSQTYLPGWLVTSGGNTYRCILASTNNVPPNATYWVLTTGDGINTINVPRLQIATPSGTATGTPNFTLAQSGGEIAISASGSTITFTVSAVTSINADTTAAQTLTSPDASVTIADPGGGVHTLQVNYAGPCKCLPPGDGFGIIVWDPILGVWVTFPACKDGYVLVFDSTEPYGIKCVPNCCPDIPKYWYCLDEPAGYPTKACCPKPLPDTLTMTVIVGAVTDTATLTYDGGSGTWIGTGMFGTCDMADWNLSCDGTDWILDVNGTTYTSLQSVCEPFSAIFSGVDLTSCGETTGGVVSIVQ